MIVFLIQVINLSFPSDTRIYYDLLNLFDKFQDIQYIVKLYYSVVFASTKRAWIVFDHKLEDHKIVGNLMLFLNLSEHQSQNLPLFDPVSNLGYYFPFLFLSQSNMNLGIFRA